MHRAVLPILTALLLLAAPTHAAEQRIIKVLPHLLDQNARHTVSPSLFERDAYQAWLKGHPEEQSGIRYDVHWQSREPGEFTLKLELLGRVEKGQASRRTIETKVSSKRANARWSGLSFTGEEFKQFGPIVAWRVTVWRDDTMLAKHQSFLWD